MRDKVNVDVFGIARDPKTGKNSIQLNMYFSLLRYLESSDAGSKVDLRFIDITKTAMENFPAAQSMLKNGKPLPMVAINGVVKYFGSIPYENVYQDVKKIIASK
jgi:hypothetical protein